MLNVGPMPLGYPAGGQPKTLENVSAAARATPLSDYLVSCAMRAASASASAAFAVSGFGASARPYPRTARHSSAMVDEIRGRSSPTSSPADAFWIATKADERPPRAPIKRPAHRAGKRTFVDWPDSTSSLSHCVKTWVRGGG